MNLPQVGKGKTSKKEKWDGGWVGDGSNKNICNQLSRNRPRWMNIFADVAKFRNASAGIPNIYLCL